MGRLLSGHPLSGAILVIALVLAMAVELLARGPASVNRRVAGVDAAGEDVSRFGVALGVDTLRRVTGPAPATDPFDAPREEAMPVSPSLRTAAPAARLTAILIAEDGSVAVIDDEAVSVGGTLRTGERVASIQADRVWVVKPNGQWRALVLPGSGR